MEIRKLKPNDPTFPAALRDIPTPPQQLYVLGDLGPLLARPRLAVVGSRKITNYGRYVTTKLVSGVVSQGVVTVSGLAFGVDSLAHEVTLRHGGQTIAVIASGLHNITPTTNAPLAKRILEKGGALISEYAPSTWAQTYQYIARNRIIAGLSDALLVTEAGLASGTRHTAQFAVDQGRDVLSVPGDINKPSSAGTNKLIRDYAIAVTEAQDILLALGVNPAPQTQLVLVGDSEAETKLLNLINDGVFITSKMHEASGLDVPTFNQTLSILEINARIKNEGGQLWSLL